MKKISLMMLSVVMTMAATAQQKDLETAVKEFEQTTTFGHTLSIGGSWIHNGDNFVNGYDKKDPHVSYGIGMKMIKSFHPNWGIMTDFKFSSEGGTYGRDNSDARIAMRVNYLRHALQGVYFFGDRGNRVRPRLSAGPSIALYVGGKTRLRDGGNIEFEDIKSKMLFKTWDFGLTGSAGVNVRLKETTWLTADVNYYHGLTNINDVTDQKMRNRGLAFNIGLLMSPDHKKMMEKMGKKK